VQDGEAEVDEEEEEDVVEAPRKYPRSKAQVSNPLIDTCMCVCMTHLDTSILTPI
jgi:hypothetical protein